MSYRTQTCLVLTCDGCSKDYDDGEGFTPHFDAIGDGRDEARDACEWWSDGKNLDLCDDCKILKSHDFTASRNRSDHYDRCGIENDEHESPVDQARVLADAADPRVQDAARAEIAQRAQGGDPR